jgi:hypothetical protein
MVNVLRSNYCGIRLTPRTGCGSRGNGRHSNKLGVSASSDIGDTARMMPDSGWPPNWSSPALTTFADDMYRRDGQRLLDLIREMLAALRDLHSAGVMHRFLHPGNVTVGPRRPLRRAWPRVSQTDRDRRW